MKRLFIVAVLLVVVVMGFYLINRSAPERSIASDYPATNSAVHPQIPVQSLAINGANVAPAEKINAITATNIGQLKALIKGLRSYERFVDKTFGSESWNMEWPERHGGIPITLQSKDQSVAYTVNFIDVKTFLETGNIQRVEMHSPMMSINETRALGLQLCSLLNLDSKDFSAWCDKVGNHWVDAPLYSSKGNIHLGFETLMTYDDRQPWFINFVIVNREK